MKKGKKGALQTIEKSSGTNLLMQSNKKINENLNDKRDKNSKIENFFTEKKEFSSKKRMRDSITNEDKLNKKDKINSKDQPESEFNEDVNLSITIPKYSYSSESPKVVERIPKTNSKENYQNSTESKTKESEDGEPFVKNSKAKKNRNSCSICRDGGDLILCDNCPKSFHPTCLKIKELDIPDGDWYCANCIPIIERRNRKKIPLDERRRIKLEKRRLYRLRKKEEMKKLQIVNGDKPTGHNRTNRKIIKKLGAGIKKKGKIKDVLNEPNKLNSNGLSKPTPNLTKDTFSFPLIPVISEEIQNKLSLEKTKLQKSLLSKLENCPVKKNQNRIENINNSILRNFLLNGKKENESKGNYDYRQASNDAVEKKREKIIAAIDLTDEESFALREINLENSMISNGFNTKIIEIPLCNDNNKIDNISQSVNTLPTDEDAYKILESMTKNGKIDFDVLKELAKTNPILYTKVNNIYIKTTNIKISNGTFGNIPKKNVKYPIDDDELYKNPESYSLGKEYFDKPRGKSCFIPNEYISKIFKIWDFLNTFKSKLYISYFTPEQLYCALLHKNEEIQLINEIHSSLLYIIGEELALYDMTHFSNDYDLLLIKIAIENNNYPKRSIFKKTWPQIIRMLINSNISKFTQMVTQELIDLSKHLKLIDVHNYNFSLDEKLLILEYLLTTVLNLEFIRISIKEDIDKRNELNKDKSGLQLELKNIEGRKREIERQEKFTMPRQKVETLTKKLQTIVEDNPTLSRQEINKLRKEMENEREQFKSVIKEGEEIEITRNKLSLRIEKLSDEIHEIPATNKKIIGVDGLKNEYYFYPTINKLYVKFFIKYSKLFEKGKEKCFEWRELSTAEEIEELMTKLSEKGRNEKNLLAKLKKLFPKKLKILPVNKDETNLNIRTESGLITEQQNINTIHIETLKSVLEWRNEIAESKTKRSDKQDSFDEIINLLTNLEENITAYLIKDEKEWESFDNRQNFKAWLTFIKQIPEYAKSLILFINKFKSPYKINESRPKIIEDEDSAYFSLFEGEGILDPNKINSNRVLASKAKLFSKELKCIEKHYLLFLYDTVSFSSLFLGIYIFEGIFNDLIKRREIYKKKDKEVISVNINSIDDDKSSSQNYYNNISNKKNRVEEDKCNIELDEFYYNEGIDPLVNLYQKNCDDSSYNLDNVNTRNSRSKRTRLNKITNANNNSNIIKKKKELDWNDYCYVCDDAGDLICCEECPKVAHVFCLGLKKVPEEWRCEDCNWKLANKRITRSAKY